MFVQGGDVDPGNYLGGAGTYGCYWSSVGRSSSYAYNLYFDSGHVNPSDYLTRYYGHFVRCVALGG